MKRRILPLLVLLTLSCACPVSTLLPGARVDDLLPDPSIGLAGLGDYRALLTVSFSGSIDTESVERTDTYAQSEWPPLQAGFTTVETVDEAGSPLYLLTGYAGDAHYDRQGRDGPCAVHWGPSVGEPATFRLAQLLEPVAAARSAGTETVEGIAARHYTFDRLSLDLPEDVQADGQVWIAVDGGYVVKYSLRIAAGDSFFGEGKQGIQQVEYRVSEVGAHPQVVYPEGCLPVLTDVPAMDDATEVLRLPGLLSYTSSSGPEAIAAFYAEFLGSRGWEPAGDYQLEDLGAVSIYARGGEAAVALVRVSQDGEVRRVTVSVIGETSASAAGPGAGATAGPGSDLDPVLRVSNGLSILLGLDSDEPGLPSYHLEAYHRLPAWEGEALVHYEDRMAADLQGPNVHFSDRVANPNGSLTVSEAYLIGEAEYDVENGVVQPEGTSMAKLAWVLWPLDPTVILGTGASTARAAGTELLDGRTAEVYSVDASGAMGGIAGVSLAVTAVSGTVWIDQETGALLKAELDYQADVKDADGNVMGSGDGRLEITVTQVGRVTVSLP
jgi:hypothetical protein